MPCPISEAKYDGSTHSSVGFPFCGRQDRQPLAFYRRRCLSQRIVHGYAWKSDNKRTEGIEEGCDTGTCSASWPQDVLGPPPPPFNNLPPRIMTLPSGNNKVCRNRCSGQRDCDNGCNCVYPTAKQIQDFDLGVDPVLPPSFCLAASIFGLIGRTSMAEVRLYMRRN